MTRSVFCLSAFILCIFLINPSVFAEDKYSARAVYLDIFLKAEKSYFCDESLREAIAEYKEFIKQHHYSSYVPEAMLRIAEFSQILGELEEAKKWLDEIIDNYPEDHYYTIRRIEDNLEIVLTLDKTAAWALYRRAFWFPGKNGENLIVDIERILQDYKDSKGVIHDLLLDLKERLRE